MTQRVYVQVEGFSDEERHTLNTWFRMSQSADGGYVAWDASAPCAPALALLDGDSYSARFELESPRRDKNLKFIWIGASAPPGIWQAFSRPLDWARVVKATDELFGFESPPPSPDTAPAALTADADADVDFDIDFDLDLDMTAVTSEAATATATQTDGSDLDLDLDFAAPATDAEWAPDTQPAVDVAPVPRVLAIAPSLEDRFYLRARFALADMMQMDEATDAVLGLVAARAQPYAVVLVDMDLPERRGWDALVALRSLDPPVAHVVALTVNGGWWNRFLLRRAGAKACLVRPFDPRKVYELLKKM